jgi:hypothetical protein
MQKRYEKGSRIDKGKPANGVQTSAPPAPGSILARCFTRRGFSKRRMLEAIYAEHDFEAGPVDRETFFVIVTLTMRAIEDIWRNVSGDEVFNTIRSSSSTRRSQVIQDRCERGRFK